MDALIERAIEAISDRPEWVGADDADRRRIVSKLRSSVRRTTRKGVTTRSIDLTAVGGPVLTETDS